MGLEMHAKHEREGHTIFTEPKEVTQINEIAVTPYVKDFKGERKEKLLKLLINKEGAENVKVLKFTQSLCPGCVDEEKFDKMKIDSVCYVKTNKVWQIKDCEEHGLTKSLYWGDYDMYKKAEKFQDPGIKILNPNIDKDQFEIDCPSDCGLCVEHESHTGLGNIVITNRCDLTCWYCFFYAKEGEPIYEPTRKQIQFMLKRMKNEKPVGCNSIQFTGGEPTLREDLTDILKDAKEIGYDHVQLNTNGINLAHDPNLASNLKQAGLSNLYMSFDGMTPQTNPKCYWEAQMALDSCYKAGVNVVLVPTLIGGINDHECGDMIRFGMAWNHVVKSVNFQPVSLVGRMPEKLRMKQRISIPGAIKRIEEQTDGQVGKEHWFPVPCAKQITDFIEALKEEPKYRLSIHFACGMATYAFRGDKEGEIVPLPKFFNIEGFMEYIGEMTKELESAQGSKFKKVRKSIVLAKLGLNLRKYIDNQYKPKSLKFYKLMMGFVSGGNYHGLGDFQNNSLFLGMMHFQDPYNWDLDRIHKCDIHYATPDGKIIPFCTFNVIPEMYRDKIQRRFSIPASEWEKQTGKKLISDKHHRKFTPEQMKAIKAEYDKYRRSLTKPQLEPDWGYENIQHQEIIMSTGAQTHAQQPGDFVPLAAINSLIQGGSAKFGVQQQDNSGSCGSGCGCAGK